MSLDLFFKVTEIHLNYYHHHLASECFNPLFITIMQVWYKTAYCSRISLSVRLYGKVDLYFTSAHKKETINSCIRAANRELSTLKLDQGQEHHMWLQQTKTIVSDSKKLWLFPPDVNVQEEAIDTLGIGMEFVIIETVCRRSKAEWEVCVLIC